MDKWLVIGAEWVFRAVKANLLWVGLVLLGGGIFGFFPATIALARLVRLWQDGAVDVPIGETMWREYRLNFKLGTQLLGGYGGSLLIMVINVRLAFQIHHLYFMMIGYMLLFLLVMWSLSLMYLFPLVANFDGNWLVYSKQALALALKNRKMLALQVVGILIVWLLSLAVSSLLIFGTAVIWQVYTAYCCRHVFTSLAEGVTT